MKQEAELPKTSSPSPYDFMSRYQEADGADILVITVSSALSSTYHHAVMGKEMLLETGYLGSIEVIDSKSASNGLGLMVYRAAKLVKEGMSFRDIVRRIKAEVPVVNTLIFLDTLDNVIKGGRLDRVRGAVASFLNIKLLMKRSISGDLEVIEKVRGSQNTIKRLIERIGEYKQEGTQVLAIAHSNCEEKARAVLDQIMQLHPFEEIIVSEMGPVIGTYAGEGGIVVSF
jgi:DegV family protein with EDD domain